MRFVIVRGQPVTLREFVYHDWQGPEPSNMHSHRRCIVFRSGLHFTARHNFHNGIEQKHKPYQAISKPHATKVEETKGREDSTTERTSLWGSTGITVALMGKTS